MAFASHILRLQPTREPYKETCMITFSREVENKPAFMYRKPIADIEVVIIIKCYYKDPPILFIKLSVHWSAFAVRRIRTALCHVVCLEVLSLYLHSL